MLGTIIGTIGAGILGNAMKDDPEPPKKMSYDKALNQAEDALQQPYQENREKVLDDINRNMISSGFYGQAPGDYLKQDAMTDMENDYQTQKSRYAQNLRNTNYREGWQKYQNELQQREKKFGNIGTGAGLGYQIGSETSIGGGWGAGLGALTGAFF